jgi:hypothetical protein
MLNQGQERKKERKKEGKKELNLRPKSHQVLLDNQIKET